MPDINDLQQTIRKLLAAYPIVRSVSFHPNGQISNIEFYEPPVAPRMVTHTIFRNRWYRGQKPPMQRPTVVKQPAVKIA